MHFFSHLRVTMIFLIGLVFTSSASAVDWNKQVSGFEFKNADIVKVIEKISEITGRNFIIDPQVRGKITIIERTPLTVREAYQAFLTSLALNGFSPVQSGAHWIIRSARNAQRDRLDIITDGNPPDENRMMTMIYSLNHISAEEVNKNLRIIPSKDGEMAPYPPHNALILTDYGPNLIRVANILKELDQPASKDKKKMIERFKKEKRERYKFYQKNKPRFSD